MRCPKCRCEVGDRQVCPFCGATVYIGDPTWNVAGNIRTTQTVQGGRPQRDVSRATDRRLREMATKIDLLMVLQIGSILISILVLVLSALK